jgi:hypothetical protein
MTFSWTIIGVAFVGEMLAILASSHVIDAMRRDVNSKRPLDDQLSSAWDYPTKTLNLLNTYKALYPNGNRAGQLIALYVVMAVCFAIMMLFYFVIQ